MDMNFEGAIAPGVEPLKTRNGQTEPLTNRQRARRASEPVEIRFWNKVDKSAGPAACWLWKGKPDVGSGYGRFTMDGANKMAHRVAFEFGNGKKIPKGKNVLHARGCSKLCCNPAHTRVGNQTQNAADAKAEKRLGRRLTPSEVCDIVAKVRDDGLSYPAAGALHDVSPQCVFNIMKGRTWSKLTGIGKPPRRRNLNGHGKLQLVAPVSRSSQRNQKAA